MVSIAKYKVKRFLELYHAGNGISNEQFKFFAPEYFVADYRSNKKSNNPNIVFGKHIGEA